MKRLSDTTKKSITKFKNLAFIESKMEKETKRLGELVARIPPTEFADYVAITEAWAQARG